MISVCMILEACAVISLRFWIWNGTWVLVCCEVGVDKMDSVFASELSTCFGLWICLAGSGVRGGRGGGCVLEEDS